MITQDFNLFYNNTDNQKILKSLCRKYSKNFDYEELHSSGIIGLWKAFNTYDPDKGTKITTHVYNCVNYAILDWIKSESRFLLKNNQLNTNNADKQYIYNQDILENTLLDNIIQMLYFDKFSKKEVCKKLNISKQKLNVLINKIKHEYRT